MTTGQISGSADGAADHAHQGRRRDVGCGTGDPAIRRLTDGGLRVTGIDRSDGMLRPARSTGPDVAGCHRIAMYDPATPRAGSAWAAPGPDPAGAGTFAAATAFFPLILLPRDEMAGVLGLVEADLDAVPLPFLGHEPRISGYPREEPAQPPARAGFAAESGTGRPYAPAGTALPPQLFLRCRRVG